MAHAHLFDDQILEVLNDSDGLSHGEQNLLYNDIKRPLASISNSESDNSEHPQEDVRNKSEDNASRPAFSPPEITTLTICTGGQVGGHQEGLLAAVGCLGKHYVAEFQLPEAVGQE